MARIDNQDLEHRRDTSEVNDTGVHVKRQRPAEPREQEVERDDRPADETVRKLEEALTKLPSG